MLKPELSNICNQSTPFENEKISTFSYAGKKQKKRSIKCQKEPFCPSDGTWRSNVGLKGGGKGWCGDCLKTEELEKQGLFRDQL